MPNTGPQPIVPLPKNSSAPHVTAEEILAAVNERRAERKAGEKDPNLWDLIPKKWRPWVALLLLLVGGSSASVMANARAIWSLPERVAAVEADTGEIKESLARIEEQLGGSTTKEARQE